MPRHSCATRGRWRRHHAGLALSRHGTQHVERVADVNGERAISPILLAATAFGYAAAASPTATGRRRSPSRNG